MNFSDHCNGNYYQKHINRTRICLSSKKLNHWDLKKLERYFLKCIVSQEANLSKDLRKVSHLWSPLEMLKIMRPTVEIWRTVKITLHTYLLQTLPLQYLPRPQNPPHQKNTNLFHNYNATAIAQSHCATANGHNSTATNTQHILLLILPTYSSVDPVTTLVLPGLFVVAWKYEHIWTRENSS